MREGGDTERGGREREGGRELGGRDRERGGGREGGRERERESIYKDYNYWFIIM